MPAYNKEDFDPKTWALHEQIQAAIRLTEDVEQKRPRKPTPEEWILVGIAAFYMVAQMFAAALKLWGWPSDWF